MKFLSSEGAISDPVPVASFFNGFFAFALYYMYLDVNKPLDRLRELIRNAVNQPLTLLQTGAVRQLVFRALQRESR